MERDRPPHHQDTSASWDDLTREPLPRGSRDPRSPQTPSEALQLSMVAVLILITVVGTSFLIVHDLRSPGSKSPAVHATAPVPTATPTPSDAADNGWTQVTPAGGDVKFSASSPQRGYLCGFDQKSGHIGFGVTTDGGQHWTMSVSPATYQVCSIQISTSNALDVVISSEAEAGPANSLYVDVHYSTDGGQTWNSPPIPPKTPAPGGALWAGPYLYVWWDTGTGSGESSVVQVSAYGGPFVPINSAILMPGAQTVSIGSAVASGAHLYLNVTYTTCASQGCWAILASGDGGATWTQVPNQSNIQLMYKMGTTFYGGQVTDSAESQSPVPVMSSDGGDTWPPLMFPPLPNGQALDSQSAASYLPILNGTIFVGSPNLLGVAYLSGDAWKVIPFSSIGDGYIVSAVSFDASGQPQRVWDAIASDSSQAGIYWHTLP